uniref:Uncharacterized protein n=1 Tax=Athene cunicularia TaxID=194338 RepID=A0A663NBX4_ATHCN
VLFFFFFPPRGTNSLKTAFLLKEYQQKNSPGATAGTKKKRKTKEGSRPETPTNDDRQPPENVSSWGRVVMLVSLATFDCRFLSVLF